MVEWPLQSISFQLGMIEKITLTVNTWLKFHESFQVRTTQLNNSLVLNSKISWHIMIAFVLYCCALNNLSLVYQLEHEHESISTKEVEIDLRFLFLCFLNLNFQNSLLKHLFWILLPRFPYHFLPEHLVRTMLCVFLSTAATLSFFPYKILYNVYVL